MKVHARTESPAACYGNDTSSRMNHRGRHHRLLVKKLLSRKYQRRPGASSSPPALGWSRHSRTTSEWCAQRERLGQTERRPGRVLPYHRGLRTNPKIETVSLARSDEDSRLGTRNTIRQAQPTKRIRACEGVQLRCGDAYTRGRQSHHSRASVLQVPSSRRARARTPRAFPCVAH